MQNAGLVIACKQLYDETYSLYFKHTEFFSLHSSDLKFWLRMLPSRARRALRSVTLFHVLRSPYTAPLTAIAKKGLQMRFLW